MNRPVAAALFIAVLALTGCLSKVPPEERAGDSWRQTAESLSRPTTMN